MRSLKRGKTGAIMNSEILALLTRGNQHWLTKWKGLNCMFLLSVHLNSKFDIPALVPHGVARPLS